MDQSIMLRHPPAAKKVYQHPAAVTDISIPKLCAQLIGAIRNGDSLTAVNKDDLFTLFVAIDNELEYRKDFQYGESHVPMGIEHAVNPLGNGLCDDEVIHSSEITMAEWEAVAAIHVDPYDNEE